MSKDAFEERIETAQEVYAQAKELAETGSSKYLGVGALFFMMFQPQGNNIDSKSHNFDFLSSIGGVKSLLSYYPENELTQPFKETLNIILADMIENYQECNDIYVLQKRCTCCNKNIDLYFDGKVLFAKDECDAISENMTFEIAVPSGELLCGNDFRELFPDMVHAVNELSGLKECMKDYASLGMFHPYVGNSCPVIEKNKKTGVIEIGVFEGINRIETPLWWVSVMDTKMFKKHCKIKGLKIQDTIDELVYFKIKVKPGMYRCTFHNTKSDVYASLEYISSEIPESKLDVEKVLENFDKVVYEDCFEDYLNTKYSSIYNSFPQYVYLTVTGLVKGDNYVKGNWFPYIFDREKFLKQVDDKYPDLLNKFIDERFLEVKAFGSEVPSLYARSAMDDKKFFVGTVSSFIEAIPYEADVSMWAVAAVFFRDVLIHEKFECEEHHNDVKAMFNLCVTNLEERGLIEKALDYLKKMEGNYGKETINPEMKEKMKRVETYRSHYKLLRPDDNFDIIKTELVKDIER